MAEAVLEVVVRLRNELKDSLSTIKAQIDALNKAAGNGAPIKAEGAVKTTSDLHALGEQAKSSVEAVGKLSETVTTLGKAFLALEVVRFITDLAKAAAQEELLIASMHAVAASAGIASGEVDVLQKSMKEMGYSSEAAASAITRFIRADLPIDKLEAFARGARDVAIVAGTDVPSALNRMIFSVQNLTTRSLRQVGITVDLTSELQKYARENNTVVSALDHHTKSLALMEVVQLQMDKQAKASSLTQGLLARQMQLLAVQTEEAKTSIGKSLIPLYQLFIEEGLKLVHSIQEIGQGFDSLGTTSEHFAETLRPVVEMVRTVIEFFVRNIDVVLKVAAAYGILKIALSAGTAAASTFTALTAGLAGGIGLVVVGITALVGAVALLTASLYSNAEAMEKADKAAGNTENYEKFVNVIKGSVINTIKEFITSAGNLPGAIVNNVKAAMAEIDKIAEEARKTLKLVGEGGPTMEGLQQQYVKLNDLAESRVAAEKRVAEAMAKGNEVGKAMALVQVEEILMKEKQQQLDIAEYERLLIKKLGHVGITKELVDQAVLAARKELALGKEGVEIDNVLAKYKLVGAEAAKGIKISDSYEAARTAFDRLVDAFRRGLRDSNGELRVTQNQIDGMREKLLAAAKTPDEISNAISAMNRTVDLADHNVQHLMLSLRDRLATATLKEAEDKTKDWSTALKGVVDAYTLVRGVSLDSRKANDTLVEGLAKVGVSLLNIRAGIISYGQAFSENIASTRAGTAAVLDGFKAELDESRTANTERIRLIRDVSLEEEKAIRTSKTNSAAKTAALIALEADASKKNLDSWKTYYDELKKKRDELVRDTLTTLDAIKAIQEKMFQNDLTRQDKIASIRQKGMTEEQKTQDNLNQSNEAYALAEQARLAGNLKLAEQYSNRAIALNDKIQLSDTATDQEKEKAISQVNTLFDQQQAIQQGGLDEQSKKLKAQVSEYEKLKGTLESIGTIIQNLANKEIVTLTAKLEITPQEMQSFIRSMQDALDKASLTVKVDVQGGTQGRAEGGMIYGPGSATSDSVPIMASAGEYMVRAAAVQHYGPGLMEMINRMELPRHAKFAEGGMIPGAANSPSMGRDMVDVNLNVGGQKVSLMGERAQVRRLVGAFKNLEGG